MAEEERSTGFLGLSSNTDKMPLEDIGEEKIEQISQDVKAKTTAEMNLGTDASEMQRQRDSVSSRLLQSGKLGTGAGTPLTTTDAEKLGADFYSPDLNKEYSPYVSTSKFVPRPDLKFTGTGFFGKALRLPGVKEVVPPEVSGEFVGPQYSLYEDDNEQVMLRDALRPDGIRTDTSTGPAVVLGEVGETFTQDVDVLSGTVKVTIPIAHFNPTFATEAGFANPGMPEEAIQGSYDMYIKFEKKTQEEINNSIEKLKRGYKEREANGLYNPFFKSLPDIPLEFEDYGYNVRAKKNAFNDITGYAVDPRQTDLGRDLQRSLGTVYDAFSQIALPAGMWAVDYAGRTAIGGLGEILSLGNKDLDQWDMNTGKAEGTFLKGWIKNATQLRDKYADAVPSSADILANYMYVPDAESAINGYLTWSEEDIYRYVQGKDAPALRKFFADYAAGLMFAKVIDKIMLPIVGLGPKNAEKFMMMINGDMKLTKRMAKTTGWETGFDIWKKTQTVKGKDGKKLSAGEAEDVLRGRWAQLRQGDKAHYTNKAFSSYLQAYNKQNSTILYPESWGNKLRMNRLDVGKSIPAHWQRVKIGERLASSNGVFFSEIFGEEYYFPAAVGGAVGMSFAFNTKWYKRALTTRTGAIALAPAEFGKGGTFSGIDSIYYAITKKGRPLQERGYNVAMADAASRGVPEGERNLWVYENYGLISDDPTAGKLPPFYVIDDTGQEKLVKPGDKEYETLQDVADQINMITDPAVKARQIDSIKKFLDLQNGFADQIKKAADNFLANNPGGNVTQYVLDHPLNKLGGALFEVLDLFTTRVAAESLASKANFGRLKGIQLADAEIMYQRRREKLDSIGRYMDEASTFMRKSEVDENTNILANKLQRAFDDEQNFMIEFEDLLGANESFVTRMYNLENLELEPSEIKKLELEERNQYWNELHLDALKKGPEEAKLVLRRQQLTMRKVLESMLNNMQTNHKSMNENGKEKLFTNIIQFTDNRIRTENNQIYAPLIKAMDDAKLDKIQGAEVDNVFLDIVDVLRRDPEEVLSGKNLINLHSKTTQEIFRLALQPNGNRVREALRKTFPDMSDKDISGELGFDITDDILIYGIVLEPQKYSDKAQKSIKLIQKSFGPLEINPNTIIKMHKAMKYQQYKLTRKASSKIINEGATDAELGRLEVYNRILGTKDKIDDVTGEVISGQEGTLTRIIKNTGDVNVFNVYGQVTDAYATFGATRRWNSFDEKVMGKVKRREKSLPDADGNVTYTVEYERTREEQLLALGELFLDNPEETMKMVLQKFGTKARVPTGEYKTVMKNGKQVTVPVYEDTYVIGNDIAADSLRFIIRDSISTVQNKRLQDKLNDYLVQFKDKNFRLSLKELDPSLAKEITQWAFGGSVNQKIQTISDLTTIKQGTQTWTGEYDEAGEFIFSSKNAFTLKGADERLGEQFGTFDLRRRVEPARTLEDQWNKPIFNWQDDSNRMFDLEYTNAVESNVALKNQVKKVSLSIKNADTKVRRNAKTYKKKVDLKHNALEQYLKDIGLKNVPTVEDGAQLDITTLSKLLFSDGTGNSAAKFEEFLLTAKSSTLDPKGKQRNFLSGPNSVRKAEAKEYVDMLLKHHYINEVLVEAGTRTYKTIDGKSAITPNFVPDYSKVKKAERDIGPLLQKRFGEEYTEKFLTVAELMTFGSQDSGLKQMVPNWQSRTMLNTPTQLSIASGLARVFAVLREVVSPRWVGADAAIRDMRFRKGEVIRTLLTSDHTLKANGVSVIEALYEVLSNANYNERYGIALGRLLPTVMAQSDLEIMSNDVAVKRDVRLMPLPLGEFFTGQRTALGYVPEIPRGRDPYKDLVSGAEAPQQISGVEQFRNRIIRDFGSWTNFNNAVSSGESIKARELYKQWEAMKLRDTRSGEGNPIINQMNMLIQNQ